MGTEKKLPLSPEEMAALKSAAVCVVGCGGIGGYAIEFLLRLGVGLITAVDGDCFDDSNLDRQLYCTVSNSGENKALAASRRASLIAPEVCFHAACEYLDAKNSDELIAGCSVVIDGLDNAPARKLLAEACFRAGIPLVHGAVSGWTAQAAVFEKDNQPGSLFDILPPESGTLPFVPAYCAALETAEAVKIICGREPSFGGRLISADLLYGERMVTELEKNEK